MSFRVKDEDNAWSDPAVSWVNVLSTSPVATIISITPNPVNYESTATFVGSAVDPDGNVTVYLWRSSIDGTLSTSLNFTKDDLSLGNHTIYFKVKDDDGQWSTEVSSWIRVNAYPVLTSYNLSSSSVLRTSTSVLSIQVSDTEDPNSTLTVVAQYRATSGGWSTSYLSTLWYDSSVSKWKTNFTPPSSAVLGDYVLRIMVNDTDGASTGWSTYSDVITVNNNDPVLQNYGLSSSLVLRTNTIVIGVNTTDTEDSESTHTVVVQYRVTSGWSTGYLSTVWYDS